MKVQPCKSFSPLLTTSQNRHKPRLISNSRSNITCTIIACILERHLKRPRSGEIFPPRSNSQTNIILTPSAAATRITVPAKHRLLVRGAVDHSVNEDRRAEGLGFRGVAFQLSHAQLQLFDPVGEARVLLCGLLQSRGQVLALDLGVALRAFHRRAVLVLVACCRSEK